MKRILTFILAITLTICPFRFLNGQEPQQPDDVVRIRSNEVRLDIVVKDKKGHTVKDLTQTDFEVLEDGVPQQIQSFRFVNREASPEPTKASPSGGGNENQPDTSQPVLPERRTTPGVTALVFDRLSPQARSLAKKAGLAYTQQGMSAGDFTGVFRIDQSLITLQPFTDNSELVTNAVGRATDAIASSYTSGAQRTRDLADQNVGLQQEMDTAQSQAMSAGGSRDSAGASAAAAAGGQAAAQQVLNQMEANILQMYEALERDQQGFATINGLLAVINPMRNLPGRKTIIFFSEGLVLPTAVQAKFPAVISAANKANVSIYTIDAAGLRTDSGTLEAAKELNSIAAQRMSQNGRGTDRGVNGPYMKSLERNEDLLKFDPRSGLGQLADQTGGFLIHDTNDLTGGVRRISDDMHGYYLLTYVPKNEDYNGRFRQINVKLNHSNLELQTRKGYYAVESMGQMAVLDYEAPAIAAARKVQSEGNSSLPFKGAALSFPAGGRPGLTLIIGESPMSAFIFAPAADKKTYNTDFSVVALIKDKTGQVLQKVSRHYPLSGPIEQMDSARKGDLLFYREAQLPAGSYSVELIAHDELSGKTSVQVSALEIPAVDEGKPRLSSVSVLKRAERLSPEEQKTDQPFHFGELLVYPNLGEMISKSQAKQLAFFVTAWPAKGSSATMQLTFTVLQNNKALGKSSTPLPAADERGQIKYASSFSLADFQPGVYQLQVMVSDGKSNVNRVTDFTLAP